MFLNSLQFSRKKKTRVGRGGGSGLGKTCGRGHKGQKARAGGFHKLGFEGGQTPLHRRLPKFGFTPLRKKYTAQINLIKLNIFQDDFVVDLLSLKKFNLISNYIKNVKIILSREDVILKFKKRLVISKLKVSKGALQQILSNGGSIISK